MSETIKIIFELILSLLVLNTTATAQPTSPVSLPLIETVVATTASSPLATSSTPLPPEASEAVTVSKVIDGDTIQLADGRKVRYIGINTPETKHPRKGVECFGKEASLKNKELVLGKVVFLEKDISETDRYGRLLRYVWLDDEMINLKLVNEGFAYSSSYPPDVKYQAVFAAAAKTAQSQSLGLWSESACLELK